MIVAARGQNLRVTSVTLSELVGEGYARRIRPIGTSTGRAPTWGGYARDPKALSDARRELAAAILVR